MKTRERISWALCGLLAVALLGGVAGVARGGSLDPAAGPASTMRSLDDLPPSWHRTLSAAGGCNSERFACVLETRGVLDRETGLVWRANANHFGTAADWHSAVQLCQNVSISGRQGWRLPTIEELGTLVENPDDISGGVPTGIPAGNPFFSVQTGGYWSSTTSTTSTTSARMMDLTPDGNVLLELKTVPHNVICVRGGQGLDAY
jgi:hypothetical protein